MPPMWVPLSDSLAFSSARNRSASTSAGAAYSSSTRGKSSQADRPRLSVTVQRTVAAVALMVPVRYGLFSVLLPW